MGGILLNDYSLLGWRFVWGVGVGGGVRWDWVGDIIYAEFD